MITLALSKKFKSTLKKSLAEFQNDFTSASTMKTDFAHLEYIQYHAVCFLAKKRLKRNIT